MWLLKRGYSILLNGPFPSSLHCWPDLLAVGYKYHVPQCRNGKVRGGQQVSDGYIDALTTFLGPGTLGHGETGPLQRYDWVWTCQGQSKLGWSDDLHLPPPPASSVLRHLSLVWVSGIIEWTPALLSTFLQRPWNCVLAPLKQCQ